MSLDVPGCYLWVFVKIIGRFLLPSCMFTCLMSLLKNSKMAAKL